MIFVTVGMHHQGFDRLIRKMDEIAGKTDEHVVMQVGYTSYKPMNAEYFSFLDSSEDILKLNKDARIVVSHAGAGSILTALEQKTPVIVVPRLKKYNEHTNDHQLEIAKAMSENKNVTVLYDVDDLEIYLDSYFSFIENRNENKLARSLKTYLDSINC